MFQKFFTVLAIAVFTIGGPSAAMSMPASGGSTQDASLGSFGTLDLRITDPISGEEVPARVEILGADGVYHVAQDALPVGGDCDVSEEGAGYVDLASTLAGLTDSIENPYTQSTQFYSNGKSAIRLPAGTATITVFRGPEFRVPIEKVVIQAGVDVRHDIELERWVNMPRSGWYSADDHLHIARPVKELNPYILKMTMAEDIHVANLLQMGRVTNFSIAEQHAHGEDGHYQQGNYILAAGQENPRTHFLGHTISLGADEAIHKPDDYLIYRLLWEEVAAQGGLNGFAHAIIKEGFIVAPHDGMAVVLPHNLLNFVEVLQFNRSDYSAWYDILSLGFRVAPTAGTDYPCAGQSLPGHERFYTRVEGPLTYGSWLDGLRKGRTFVTTGPMIEFRVNGEDIGSEILLGSPATVMVEGSASFDPARDDLSYVELVHNGNVIKRVSRVGDAAIIRLSAQVPVQETSWFALRGYGDNANWGSTMKAPHQFSFFSPRGNVHSAPIYVTLKNKPKIAHSATSRNIARSWLARLEDIERVLAPDNIEHLAQKIEFPGSDGVPRHVLINNRPALLREIDTAKGFFLSIIAAEPGSKSQAVD